MCVYIYIYGRFTYLNIYLFIYSDLLVTLRTKVNGCRVSFLSKKLVGINSKPIGLASFSEKAINK